MAASNKGNWAPKQINRPPPGERLQLKRDFLGNAIRAPARAPNRTQHIAELSVTHRRAARAEDGGADAYISRAELDGAREVSAHSHAELSCAEPFGNLGEQSEVHCW